MNRGLADISRLSLMTFDMQQDLALGKMTVEDLFVILQETGIPSMDVMNLSERQAQVYLQLMQRYPGRIYCYIATCSMLETREKIEAAVGQGLAIGRMLGASLLMLVPVNAARDGRKARAMGHDQVINAMIHGYQLAVDAAKGSGIRVCLETTPQDFSCCSGIDDCRRILQAVPGLGHIYDTANMLPHGDDPLAYYEALKPWIVYTHLKDVTVGGSSRMDRLMGGEYLPDGEHMQGVLPGEGKIPLREILARMRADGYPGRFAIEYRRPHGLRVGREKHIAQLKKVLSYLEKD